MLKKIISIIIILLVIVAVSLGIYWFFEREQGGAGSNFNIADYLPFGKSPDATSSTSGNGGGGGTGNDLGTNTGETGTSTTTFLPQLWKISSDPQSGAVVFSDVGGTFVRYLDTATGNVFESDLSGTGINRISNTTIPKVYETDWEADGNSLVLRYVPEDNTETVKSLYAKLVMPTSTSTEATSTDASNLQELQGSFLASNISQFLIEPGNTGEEKAFYLLPEDGGGSGGYISNIDGSNSLKVFDSPLHEWLVSWPKDGTLAFATKPSAEIPGYLYFLNTQNGDFRKILGDVNGLTALVNPDASQVLYSESGENTFSLGMYTPKTATKAALPQKTLPEKCVWSKKDSNILFCAIPKSIPSGNYPDTWYQGLVSFNDTIWRVNASTSEADLIVDPKEKAGVEIDATNLMLDKDEKYLIFTNKKDSQLWGLRLLENSGV